MGRELRWEPVEPGKVVHVVGHLTDTVFGFLAPATHALARSGRAQAVVVIDELQNRHHIAGLHDAAELVLTPPARGILREWGSVFVACRRLLSDGPIQAVHLHGLMPCIVGAWALRASGVRVPIVYSAHGNRSQGVMRGIFGLATLLSWPFRRPSAVRGVAVRPMTEHSVDQWESTELVESPVASVFFRTPRKEARHPLIVTDGRGRTQRGVELFAQLAVLLSGEDLRVSFNWIGTVDPVSRLRLIAANVGIFGVNGTADCAARLASGWIYVAPCAPRGFPLDLAQAMAVGLPCVVLDCPQHREFIRDAETGYLCRTERDMIERIAMLIDDDRLRARIGAAAREETKPRFGESEFGAKLMAAYALSAPPFVDPAAVRVPEVRPLDIKGYDA